MKKYRTTVFLALSALFLAIAITACGGRQSGSTETKDSLIVISSGSPSTLDPTLANDTSSSMVMKQIYSTLFNLDVSTMTIVPGLAERHQFENDASGQPTRLRLFLRQGVKFHNGEELKARDVKFSLDRAKASPVIAHIVGSIASVEIVNDYEVLITLHYPFVPLLNNLAQTVISITNEKAVTEGGADYARNPVGTGPMKFVNWVTASHIDLTRWDEYYGDAPKIKDITIRYIGDPATALLEMETGGADLLLNVQPQDVARIQANQNLQLIRATGIRIHQLGFNNQKPPFDNPLVRRALFHAVDTNAIVRTVYQDVGSTGKGPLTSNIWGSAANILPQYEYNPELARQLLAEAKLPDSFTTSITTFDSPVYVDYAVLIKNMLEQVGVTVDINVGESASIGQLLNRGEHEMFIANWGTTTGDPDYGLTIFHTASFGSPGNRSFYSNAEVDRLIEAGRRETNPEQRRQIYLDIQYLIHADTPWIYLWENEILIAAGSKVRGFAPNPMEHHWLWTAHF